MRAPGKESVPILRTVELFVSFMTEGGLLGFSDQCQNIKHAMFSLRGTTTSRDFVDVITDLIIHINEIILTIFADNSECFG